MCRMMLTLIVDLASVTAVDPHTSANVTARQAAPSPNSFSIMSSAKSSLLDLVCIHTEQYAEWIDGFKMLRHEAGGSTKETANYVHVGWRACIPYAWTELAQILADLALKVRLLGKSLISGLPALIEQTCRAKG